MPRNSKLKQCRYCNKILPVTMFTTCCNGKYLRGNCKSCGVKQATEHRDRVRERWHGGLLTKMSEKRCPSCKKTKDAKHFAISNSVLCGLAPYCRPCARAKALRHRHENKLSMLIRSAKTRAKKKGIAFNIDASHLSIPSHCPVMGIKIEQNLSVISDGSPSIDRINNRRGYVKGNVIVVSVLANRIKSTATPDQILAVGNFYKRLTSGASA